MSAFKLPVASFLALTSWLVAGAAQALAPGEQLYNDNCAACHRKAGQGVPGAFPALKADKVALGDPKAAALILLTGKGGMPAFKDSLSDAELASIMTYVRASWGNKAKPIPAAVFARARTGPPPSARLQAH
jgi:mono/diheme cytochrome c family protein